MNEFGLSKEQINQTLNLIIERGRFSYDLLKAHFGFSAYAVTILSFLETNRFITKPYGAERWEVNFPKIKRYLATINSYSNSKTEKIELPTTIKKGGLKNILNKLYLADANFNILSILTADLTISEIDESLELIQIAKTNYKHFINQRQILLERSSSLNKKITKVENKINIQNQVIDSKGSPLTSTLIFFVILIFCGIGAFLYGMPTPVVLGGMLCLIVIGFFFLLPLGKQKKLELKRLQEEKLYLKNDLQTLEDEQENLNEEESKIAIAYGLDEGATPELVNVSNARLLELENILQKMKNILITTPRNSSEQILALEQLLYLLNKKYIEEKMLSEQQKATTYAKEQADYARQQADSAQEQVQAIKDLETAINIQTDMQYWQGQEHGQSAADLAHIASLKHWYNKHK